MVYLSGASDDCIEIDGDQSQEINADSLWFETEKGTEGKIEFGDKAQWHITIKEQGEDFKELRKANEEEKPHEGLPRDIKGYSDVLVLEDNANILKMVPLS